MSVEKVDQVQLAQAVDACLTITKSNQQKNANLLGAVAVKIFATIGFIKVPDIPQRIIRLPLKHSFYEESYEICLFVKDEKNRSPKWTISKYENLMKRCKVEAPIKKIITLEQLRKEYECYDLKKKLCNQFDLFLTDVQISKDVSIQLTTMFAKNHKAPVPISLNRKNGLIRKQIDNATKKTAFHAKKAAASITFQVATNLMTSEHIVDNLNCVFNHLHLMYPKAGLNVRSISLFSENTPIHFPIFYSLKSKNLVPTPKVKSLKSKHCQVVTDELSTYKNHDVEVHPNGIVRLKKKVEN